MIVVVDDERVFPFRATYFRALRPAMEFFSAPPEVHELWLDHDLGLDLDGQEMTIRPLVGMLERSAYFGEPYPIGSIWLCTMNDAGYRWMEQALSPYYEVKDGRWMNHTTIDLQNARRIG